MQEEPLEQLGCKCGDTGEATEIAQLLCPNSLTHSLFANVLHRGQSSVLHFVHSPMECFKHHSQHWLSNFINFLIQIIHSVLVYLLTYYYLIND